MNDNKFTESDTTMFENKIKEHTEQFSSMPVSGVQTNPIMRKFIEFTKPKYKFSIKDFYFK